jgi:hypothetical protein
MKLNAFAIFIFVFLAKGQIFSQTTSAEGEPTKKILFYTFSGPASLEELQALQKDVLLVTDVKEVKAEYKVEKKLAQLRVVFIERKKIREGDKDFDFSEIKKLILKYNYVPGDFKVENAEQ